MSFLFMVKRLGSCSSPLRALCLLYPKLHPQTPRLSTGRMTSGVLSNGGSGCHKAVGYTCCPSGKAKGSQNSTQAVTETNKITCSNLIPEKELGLLNKMCGWGRELESFAESFAALDITASPVHRIVS